MTEGRGQNECDQDNVIGASGRPGLSFVQRRAMCAKSALGTPLGRTRRGDWIAVQRRPFPVARNAAFASYEAIGHRRWRHARKGLGPLPQSRPVLLRIRSPKVIAPSRDIYC
jgi:hypothetical protein